MDTFSIFSSSQQRSPKHRRLPTWHHLPEVLMGGIKTINKSGGSKESYELRAKANSSPAFTTQHFPFAGLWQIKWMSCGYRTSLTAASLTAATLLKACNIMIFTERWLNSGVPDSTIELAWHIVLWADRTTDDSGKTRGGGLCIYVNKAWCTDIASLVSHCRVSHG